MSPPTRLLQTVAGSLLATVDDSLLDDISVHMNWESSEGIWEEWRGQSDDSSRREEIESLAQMGVQDTETIVGSVMSERASNVSPQITRQVSAYLSLIPSAIRRCLRRPDNPDGDSLPAKASLKGPLDLLAFLPQRPGRFIPGDRPGDIGDWELVDLQATDAFGETWKAVNPRNSDALPVLLRFCLNPTAKNRLLQRDDKSPVLVFDRIIEEVGHDGNLELRRIHINSDPPCLEYEFFAGAAATSLIQCRQADKSPLDAKSVAKLMEQIAGPIGALHRLKPPIVHFELSADKILLRQTEDDHFLVKLIDTGLAGLLPQSARDELQRISQTAAPGDASWPAITVFQETDPQVYLSPAAVREERPQPRDDVYALGVLWYQLLTGKLLSGRPGGSQWRKRLAQDGMSETLLELLESCFEDDPNDRPEDAAVLAEELGRRLSNAAIAPESKKSEGVRSSAPPPASSDAGATPRQRSRRADVWDLFDSLEEEAPELTKSVTNSIGMKLVLAPAGSFQMGTLQEEAGRRENEGPRHEVAITSPLYAAVNLVTQQDFFEVMACNPSRFHKDNGGGPDYPVENVTWEQAVEFCAELSELPAEKKAGRIYRLPTEAEWEYACRGGKDTPFCFGELLSSKQANFDGNFPYGNAGKGLFVAKTTPVGRYRPNNFGLYDMHGNVWEWCSDWLNGNYYFKSPRRDPAGPEIGTFRVLRGGSWKNHGVTCRAGYRNGLAPNLKDGATGFRIVLEVKK